MKRKLISILLALALCLPLAGSAFAEGEAETPAPEEQTETLPVEAETAPDAEPAPDVAGPEDAEFEGTTWSWATSEEADQTLGEQLARLAEEGELAVGEPYALEAEVKCGHFHVDGCTMTADPPDPEDIVVGEAYTLGVYYGHICFDDSCSDMPDPVWDENAAAAQSAAGICELCGKDNWGPPTDQDPYTFEEVAGVDYHAECFLRIYVMQNSKL